MSVPVIYTVPPGSGGGLFGSIRQKFIDTPDLYAVFGNPEDELNQVRVHPGQVPPGTKLPFVTLSVVSARAEYSPASDLQGGVTYLNIWYTNFQVSTYAVGHETARQLSKLAHHHIDRKVFAVDCYEVIPYVSNLIVALDPVRSEDGREVWHFSYRYDVKIPEYMQE